MLGTLLFLIVVSYGLGHALTMFWKEGWGFEKAIMRAGLGLAAIPVLGVFFGRIGIPITWRMYLIIAGLALGYVFVKSLKQGSLAKFKWKPKLTKRTLYFIIVLVLFFAHFGMFYKGSFTYPWLEDTDPYQHATVLNYMKDTGTYVRDPGIKFGHYVEPYPIGFSILMSLLYQLEDSVMFTLKYYNALLLSFGLILFYFFAQQVFKGIKHGHEAALFATFALTVAPSFWSHFIFSRSYGMLLYFPAFYFAIMSEEERKFWIPAAVAIAGTLVVQPTVVVFMALFYGTYFLARLMKERKLTKPVKTIFLAGLVGVMIALAGFWIPVAVKFGVTGFQSDTGMKADGSFLKFVGSDASIYTFGDFWSSSAANKTDQPIGVGQVLFLLFILSVIFLAVTVHRQKSHWTWIALAWSAIGFFGVHGNRFPVSLPAPHRLWAYFTIGLVLVVGFGFRKILQIMKEPTLKALVTLLLVTLIIWTSWVPKYGVNTAQWPLHIGSVNPEYLQGYISLPQQLPLHSKVYGACSSDDVINGFDMYSEPWIEGVQDYRYRFFNDTLEENHAWLKGHGYEYVIMDELCPNWGGLEKANERLNEMRTSDRFSYAYGTTAFFAFKII